MSTAQLHLELNRLASGDSNEEETRFEFRKLIQEHTGAIGVGHLLRNKEGAWELPESCTTGRVPRRDDFVARFAKSCDATLSRNSIQVESFLGLEVFYVPIKIFGAKEEILLVLAPENKSAKILFVLEIVAAYFGIWLKGRSSGRNDWKLISLAALIELVSEVEQQSTLANACQVIASDLSRHLRCPHVGVITCEKVEFGESAFSRFPKLTLHAYSGSEKLEQRSEIAEDFKTTASETLLQREACVWPLPDDSNKDEPSANLGKHAENGLLAHQQLLESTRCDAVFSIPLVTPNKQIVGVLVLAGENASIQGSRLPNFARAAAPRLASALDVVTRAQETRLSRFVGTAKANLRTIKGRFWLIVALTLVALLGLPMPYRIRTNCLIEATERRFVVAPFEGVVEEGFFEPGDEVKAGQVLAKMDDQEIRYGLIGVRAERQRAAKKREMELAAGNVSDSLLSDLDRQRLAAKQNLLEYQQQQVELRSPIDGYILSGSLERTHGMSVDLGKVLYEVGPLSPLKIQIAIPAEEVGQAREGNHVRVWIRGFENQSFQARIERIRPQSELRDGRNVFLAEITLNNASGLLRPGMEGSVRIDCANRPLGWNLFHKPWDYLVSRLTWW